MSTVKRVTCSFERNTDQFAIVSNDNHIKIFNTTIGKNTADISAPLTQNYTCIAWSKPSKKKNASFLVALGTDSGTIIIWNLATEEIVHTLGEKGKGHSARVNDVVFSSNSQFLYSCSEDKLILQWNVKTGENTLELSTEKYPIKKLSLNADSTLLAGANTSIKLWDLSSKKLVKKVGTHPSPVVALKFGKDNDSILISASNDRFIYVWNAEIDEGEEEGNDKPLQVLSCESNPVVIDRNGAYILALLESGVVSVWNHPDTPSKKPLQAEGKISSNGVLISARFYGTDEILVAGGDKAIQFEKIGFLSNTGSIFKDLQFNISTGTTGEGAVKAKKAKSVTLGTGDRLPETNAEGSARELERSRTMQQQIQLLMEPSAVEEDSRAGVVPRADSVQAVVIQALQSNDAVMLEKCLKITDIQIVTNTVRRLPTSYVVRFLEAIITYYQRDTSHGISLVLWIKTVLAYHTSYLVTVPNLVQMLSGLYLSIDSRLSIFKKLLKLSGRLDLLLSQISAQSDTPRSNTAAMVYEEEDDEEYEDEDEEDDDDDENEGEMNGNGEDEEDDDMEDEE
eukprot:TRINITY_DN2577_c0_g1_i1.p1 TRINITY_DN2577_c0_g1~~TRINITY_DN2577_c0_g1_i1.p1  ORF type:complete len:567 (-),score=181.19 TRINITY_DN2577_c0_g1_i1:13-1713(-)